MDNVSLLVDVNQCAGVAVALVGAVVVAPSGFALLGRETWAWLRSQGNRLRGLLARFLPFLRRDVVIEGVAGGSSLGALWGTATATVGGRAWHPDASIDDRIEAVHNHVTEIEQRLGKISQQLLEGTATLGRALTELESRLASEVAQLHGLLADQDWQAARIDARGLPVVAAGIVLSGIPDQLAAPPYGVGWMFPVLGVAFAAGSGARAWSDRHRSPLFPAHRSDRPVRRSC